MTLEDNPTYGLSPLDHDLFRPLIAKGYHEHMFGLKTADSHGAIRCILQQTSRDYRFYTLDWTIPTVVAATLDELWPHVVSYLLRHSAR